MAREDLQVQQDFQENILQVTFFYFLLQGLFSKKLRKHKNGLFLVMQKKYLHTTYFDFIFLYSEVHIPL